MVKKLLQIFKKRRYVSEEQRKLVTLDLKRELEDAEQKNTNKYKEYQRKNMQIQALREILEDSDTLYTKREMSALLHMIVGKILKL